MAMEVVEVIFFSLSVITTCVTVPTTGGERQPQSIYTLVSVISNVLCQKVSEARCPLLYFKIVLLAPLVNMTLDTKDKTKKTDCVAILHIV